MARPVASNDIIDAKATIWPLPLAIMPGKNTRKVYIAHFNETKKKEERGEYQIEFQTFKKY